MTIDASNSTDAEGIVLLEWDCEGDGVFEAESVWTVAADRSHTCTYTVDGTYEPSVRATNGLVRACVAWCWLVMSQSWFLVSTTLFYIVRQLSGKRNETVDDVAASMGTTVGELTSYLHAAVSALRLCCIVAVPGASLNPSAGISRCVCVPVQFHRWTTNMWADLECRNHGKRLKTGNLLANP